MNKRATREKREKKRNEINKNKSNKHNKNKKRCAIQKTAPDIIIIMLYVCIMYFMCVRERVCVSDLKSHRLQAYSINDIYAWTIAILRHEAHVMSGQLYSIQMW